MKTRVLNLKTLKNQVPIGYLTQIVIARMLHALQFSYKLRGLIDMWN
jgi:hypothetical protein